MTDADLEELPQFVAVPVHELEYLLLLLKVAYKSNGDRCLARAVAAGLQVGEYLLAAGAETN